MLIRLLTLAIVLSLPQLAKAQGEWVEVPSTYPGFLLDLSSSGKGHLAGFVPGLNAVWSTDEGQSWSIGKTYFPYAVLHSFSMAELHYFSPSHGVALINHSYYEPHHQARLTGRLAVTRDSGRTWQGPESGSEQWDEKSWPGRIQFAEDGLVMFPTMSGAYFSNGKTSGYHRFIGAPGGPITYDVAMSGLQSIEMVLGESFMSLDSGKTFMRSATFLAGSDSLLNFSSIGMLHSGTRIAVAHGGIYRNTDGGNQWSPVMQVSGSLQFTHRFGTTYAQYRRDKIYPESLDSILLESTDDGSTWSTTRFPGEVRSVVPVSPTLTYLLAGNKIYKRERAASVKTSEVKPASIILNNPVRNSLTLTTLAESITITDISGRTVLRAASTNHVDVSALSLGVYQLLVSASDGIKSQTFVIER